MRFRCYYDSNNLNIVINTTAFEQEYEMDKNSLYFSINIDIIESKLVSYYYKTDKNSEKLKRKVFHNLIDSYDKIGEYFNFIEFIENGNNTNMISSINQWKKQDISNGFIIPKQTKYVEYKLFNETIPDGDNEFFYHSGEDSTISPMFISKNDESKEEVYKFRPMMRFKRRQSLYDIKTMLVSIYLENDNSERYNLIVPGVLNFRNLKNLLQRFENAESYPIIEIQNVKLSDVQSNFLKSRNGDNVILLCQNIFNPANFITVDSEYEEIIIENKDDFKFAINIYNYFYNIPIDKIYIVMKEYSNKKSLFYNLFSLTARRPIDLLSLINSFADIDEIKRIKATYQNMNKYIIQIDKAFNFKFNSKTNFKLITYNLNASANYTLDAGYLLYEYDNKILQPSEIIEMIL